MEKIYYKGEIDRFYIRDFCYHYGIQYSTPLSELDYFVVKDFPNKFVGIDYQIEVNDPTILEILDKKYKFETFYESDVIFEILFDKQNNMFAKEIVTGTIFPILGIEDFTRTYQARYKVNKVETDNNRDYSIDYNFDARPIHHPINPNILQLNFLITKDSYRVATKYEIEEYRNDFYKPGILGLKTKVKERFNNYLKLYNQNTYKEFDLSEEKTPVILPERQTQSEYTILMENIEFLLTQLGKIDISLKKVMYQKYNLLLEGEDKILTLEPLTIQRLKSFEAELEFIIKTNKKDNQEVTECLDNIISEYNEDTKTPRTIKDIDKLSELFLKMKDTYSVTTQRKVIEKFACVYIHEIYENKDSITLNELSNSYFNDILKSIIIYLSEMIDNGIIENNIIINYNNITPAYVLDLIKQIKFIPKIKDKQKSLNN